MHKYVYKDIIWIDIKSPTKKEVKSLGDDFRIDASVVRELLSPTLRPRVEMYETYVYFILHFPTTGESKNGEVEREVDFILGKNFIVTVHYEHLEEFGELGAFFETGKLFLEEGTEEQVGFLFFSLLRRLYQGALQELEIIDDSLTDIEKEIFRGKEHEMVYRISEISRELLDMRHAMRPHQEMLNSLESAGKKLFGDDFSYHIRTISGDYYRIASMLQNAVDVLAELRATNNSLLTTKINNIMKTLTIMAFITFPLMLFSSIFGMNTNYLPFAGNENDFWIIIGIMAATTLTLFSLFRYRKWI